MATVSVIIPTYNRPSFLAIAVQSVLNQTFEDFEIIVVDDASNDRTRKSLNQFKDKRIKYLRHEINRGEAASRNTGILRSSSEYIAFLDDDDFWMPEKLTSQIQLLKTGCHEIGCVYTGFLSMQGDQILSTKFPSKKGAILNELLNFNVIGSPSSLVIKRHCIDKVGLFDDKLPYYVDYDFYLRLSNYYLFDYVEKPLIVYRVHENNLSKNLIRLEAGLHYLQKKYDNKICSTFPNKRFYGYTYYSVGLENCKYGNIKTGRKLLKQSIELFPIHTKPYLHFLLTFVGPIFYMKIHKLWVKLKWFCCGLSFHLTVFDTKNNYNKKSAFLD